MTFWERVREYANNRVKQAYMRRMNTARRCSVCDTWTSEVGGIADYRSENDGFEETQCKRCLQWTRWDYTYGIVMFLADTQPELRRVK